MRFYVYLCIREMPTQQHCGFILKENTSYEDELRNKVAHK